jgi:hypothetical protein
MSRPSVERDAIDMELIWVGGEAKYFCEEIWTGQITLNAFKKFVFSRTAFQTTSLEKSRPSGKLNSPSGNKS